MTELKKYTISILISDPLNPNLSINKENYILNIINTQYVGKCYNGAFILKIKKIIDISSCEIITTNLLANGNINVKFMAVVRIFYPGEFIFDVHIQKTQPSILGSFVEESEDGPITAYVMIPYGIQFEPSPSRQAIMTIREHQRVPMRIIDVYHKCANPIPAIGATLLVCEKKYYKYIITSPLSKNAPALLLPLIYNIEQEMNLRNESNQENIVIFEKLLYSYRTKDGDNKTKEIISEKFPVWNGPEGIINHEVYGEEINLLDYLQNILQNDEDGHIIGVWSRPLHIHKSSPMAIFNKSGDFDEITLEEGNPDALFMRYLKDILDYLTIIRKMAEYYSDDNAKFMANKNIWDAMKEAQLIAS